MEGIVGGTLTTNKPTKAIGKNVGRANETTPEQQALAEAAARHQRKLDKGYAVTLKTAVAATAKLPEPMLAHAYTDNVELVAESWPVWSQPKLDGVRCVVNKAGLWSRHGKPFVSMPHIMAALRPLFVKDPDLELDGEAYASKLKHDFNRICSLVKRSKPTVEDLQESAEGVEYWIYDLPSSGELNFEQRHDKLVQLFGQRPPACIKLLETTEVSGQQALDKLYEHYMDEGYEGQIIRLNKPYEHKRTASLLKRKEFVDKEYTILDVVEGVGNRVGTAGYMTFKTDAGVEFRSNIKGSFEYLQQVLKDKKKLIGKQATIKYFNLTPDKLVPRFPYVIAIDRKSYEG